MGTEIYRDVEVDDLPPSQGARRCRRRLASTTVKGPPEHYSETQETEKDPVTQALGWFSIGLGAAELLAPGLVARVIGVDENENKTLLRAYGVRELIAGVAIVSRPKPTYWMWNRVLGDVVDLASLAKAMRSPENNRVKLAGATLAVLGVTALDIVCSVQLTRETAPTTGHDEGSFMLPETTDGTQVLSAVITVNKPADEVYEFWKDPANYPRFMSSLESVQITGEGRSHWKVKAPIGLTVEWDAQIVNDVPNELIAWESIDGTVHNTGTVRLRPALGNRGTEVELQTQIKPKAGPIGAKIAKLFEAVPKTQMMNDLRRFKQLMEIGEVVKSDASAVSGMHPARPPKYSELEA
ncbi:MAG TPA: SRPBCC family protein [Gemmatimonadaceae bacterium]|nr:SRPBCC family protein [Gemmatimonadaceae bacterium]